jgi:hypothetical protein
MLQIIALTSVVGHEARVIITVSPIKLMFDLRIAINFFISLTVMCKMGIYELYNNLQIT